jgi:hypothetical protein
MTDEWPPVELDVPARLRSRERLTRGYVPARTTSIRAAKPLLARRQALLAPKRQRVDHITHARTATDHGFWSLVAAARLSSAVGRR